MNEVGIYLGFDPLDSQLLRAALNAVPELTKEELPTIFDAIERRKVELREKVQGVLRCSEDPGPDYVQRALLSIVDGSADFSEAPEEVRKYARQVAFLAPFSSSLEWNDHLGFYASNASPSIIERLPFLKEMSSSLNGNSSIGLLFPVPTTPKRQIERLTMTSTELVQGEIDLLSSAFQKCSGPWWYCGSDLKVVKDEKERITVSRPPFDQGFTFYKPQTRSEFLEEHREEILKLSPTQRDCVILSLATDGVWKQKGRVTGISVDPEELRVDFSLFKGGTEHIFHYQSADEFIDRFDISKITLKKSDISWFIEFITENDGPWNQRSCVESIQDHPSGAIAINCMDGIAELLFPPASPEFFLESLKGEIAKLDKETQRFIRNTVEIEQQPWCLRGYIQRIEGSIESGLFLYKYDGNRLAIFKDQSVEDFLEKQVIGNPFLSVAARAAIEGEVYAKRGGPWVYRGYVVDFEEQKGSVVLRLADGGYYEILV